MSEANSGTTRGPKLWLLRLPQKDRALLSSRFPSMFASMTPRVINPNFLPLGQRPSRPSKVSFSDVPQPANIASFCSPIALDQLLSRPQPLMSVPVIKYDRGIFLAIEDLLSPFQWELYAVKLCGYADSVFYPDIRDQVVQSQFERYCGVPSLDVVDRKHTKAVMRKAGCANAQGKFKFGGNRR